METPAMVPTSGKDSEGGHEKKSLRSPILLSGIIVVAALSAYVFYGFNGDSFDLSDRKALLIVTDSMDGDVTEYKVDSFPEHTMVMVKGLSDSEKQDIQVGDVLSFRQGNILNHHRVVEVHTDEGYVITKGDNPNITTTEHVELSSVNGEVVGTNHVLGVVVTFVKENAMIVLAVFFALSAAMILAWVFKGESSRR